MFNKMSDEIVEPNSPPSNSDFRHPEHPMAPFLVNRFPFFFHEIKAKISIYHTITKTCKSDKKYGQPEANLDVENLKTAAVVVTRR